MNERESASSQRLRVMWYEVWRAVEGTHVASPAARDRVHAAKAELAATEAEFDRQLERLKATINDATLATDKLAETEAELRTNLGELSLAAANNGEAAQGTARLRKRLAELAADRTEMEARIEAAKAKMKAVEAERVKAVAAVLVRQHAEAVDAHKDTMNQNVAKWCGEWFPILSEAVGDEILWRDRAAALGAMLARIPNEVVTEAKAARSQAAADGNGK